MALETLATNLLQIQIDIRSFKVQIRHKALDKLDNIFNNREDELEDVLSGNIFDAPTTWLQIFDGAHEAIIQQCTKLAGDGKESATMESRNRLHINVIQKTINLANKNFPRIAANEILEKCFHCFGTPSISKYFGVCYLQILRKHILSSKSQLGEIKMNEWSRLVSYCIQMYEGNTIQKLVILQALSMILEHGCEISYLSIDLRQYLTKFENIITDSNLLINAQIELVKCVFYLCKNLALDYRFAVCKFLENILSVIIKIFKNKLEDNVKVYFYKLFHLAIVAHNPHGNGCNSEINYADCTDTWNRHLRNLLYLLQTEIKQFDTMPYRLQYAQDLCESLLLFGSSLCSIIFWDSTVWNIRSEEHNLKRQKISDKLEALLNFVEYEQGKFSWRWLKIIYYVIEKHPDFCTAADFQPLLKILSDFQTKIEHHIQVQIFIKFCKFLMLKEPEYANSILINKEFCQNIWNEIAQTAYRGSFSTSLSDNLTLLSLFYVHNHQPPLTLTEAILTNVLSNSLPKNNKSVQLIINIFQHVNLNTLENVENVNKNILDWLHQKRLDLRSLYSNMDLDMDLVSELSVLCIFSKIKQMPNTIGQSTATEYEESINNLKKYLQLKSLSKLIVEENSSSNKVVTGNDSVLPKPNELKSVIHEEYFDHLFKILNEKNESSANSEHFEKTITLSSSIALHLNILNQMIVYESLDTDRFHKTFLAKKVALQLEQIQMSLVHLNPDQPDLIEILNSFLEIFNQKLHTKLYELINQTDLNTLIQWIGQKIVWQDHRHSKFIELKSKFTELASSHQVRYKAFMVLSYFVQETNGEQSLNILSEYDFNFNSNADLFIIHELLSKQLKYAKPSEKRAIWIFNIVKMVCKSHHRNQQISSAIINLLPDILMFVKDYSSMTDSMLVVVNSFLSQSKKKKYGPVIVAKFIENLKYVAKAYPHLLNDIEFMTIFLYLENFLTVNMTSIQFAAVDTIISIFNTKWISEQENHFGQPVTNFKRFHSAMLEKIQTLRKLMMNEDEEDVMEKDNHYRVVGVLAQLYCGVICVNASMRKTFWFLFAELCPKSQMEPSTFQQLITIICKFLNINDRSSMINENILYLISMWIKYQNPMAIFPWYMAQCDNQNDFFLDYIETITFCIVKCKPTMLDELIQLLPHATKQSLLEPILSDCLAYILPFMANCSTISQSYKDNCKIVQQTINNNIGSLEDLLVAKNVDIVEKLFFNLWDEEKFQELFNIDIDFQSESDETIDCGSLKTCMEFLLIYLDTTNKSKNIIFGLYKNSPIQLNAIFLSIKSKIEHSLYSEQKLLHLFRYCILVQFIEKYLCTDDMGPRSIRQEGNNVKQFFIRDILYFLCNHLVTGDLSRNCAYVICRYLSKFCKTIMSNCAKLFEPFLNFIVCTLTPLIQRYENDEIAQISMDLLEFLIVHKKNELRSGISLLHNFPDDVKFNTLKQIHHDIKYNEKLFSLSDEIDDFLKLDERKIEGFISMRQHLTIKKSDLVVLYKNLQEGGKNKARNLPSLIVELLQTIHRLDTKKSFEAAKCLGEMGPQNLGAMVLEDTYQNNIHPELNNLDEAIQFLCKIAVEKLDKLLLHPNTKVLKVVYEALAFLLKSKTVHFIADKYPCLEIFKSPIAHHSLIYKMPSKQLDLSNILNEGDSFSIWVKNVSSQLFQFFDDKHLEAVASIQLMFAEATLPPLIDVLLCLNKPSIKKTLKDNITSFFKKTYDYIMNNDSLTSSPESIFINSSAIKTMLKVAECIRIYDLKNIKEQIELNNMHIAKAAQHCEAYFTSILYAEMWSLEQINANEKPLENPILQDTMRKSYLLIGKTDAALTFVDPTKSRLDYLALSGQNPWHTLLYHDTLLSQSAGTSGSYQQFLANSGLHTLYNKLERLNSDLNSSYYECAWRLGDWDVLLDKTETKPNAVSLEFDKHHYTALKCLQIKDEMGVQCSINLGRQAIVSSLKSASTECTHNIYKYLQSLNLLQQIEDFTEIQFSHGADNSRLIFEKWQQQDQMPYSDFKYREQILAQRLTLFNLAGIRATRKLQAFYCVEEVSHSTILNLLKLARKEGHYDLATRYLAMLHQMNLSPVNKAKLLLEDGQLNWKLGQESLAKTLVYKCFKSNIYETNLTRAIALRKYGKYLADSYSENVKTITDKYFTQSISFIDNLAKDKTFLSKMKMTEAQFQEFSIKNRTKAHAAIAKYSDREYTKIVAYLKSDEFKQKKKCTETNQENVRNMGNDREKITSKAILNRFTKFDEAEIRNVEDELQQYLKLALTNYLQACYMQNGMSTTFVFRIISLWFSNQNNSNANATIKETIMKIPTFKFLVVLPQIAAWISNTSDNFYGMVYKLIDKCAIDHPHHCVPQILALSNAYADKGPAASAKLNDERVAGARNLIQSLRRNEKTSLIVSQMEQMSEALILLANKRLERSTMPSSEQLRKIKNLTFVQCPTIDLPISEDGKYPNVISIVKWSDKFGFVGGVNAPKKLSCLCSDGRNYPQLLKGQDDLRQDAVMQQVFTIMNQMLKTNKITLNENLNVKTYKVVPLSQRSGILEWCANTIPISEYLMGSSRQLGAHQRFRPQDMDPKNCRAEFEKVSKQQSHPVRLHTYTKICSQIKPVFQYFFLEYFQSPGKWFEKRLAYTNSVATNSMIGYILGIGDRHVSNILIDQESAELIHIDFGIAFEQGKCLPTPETVPFRLSRDIVAPFGVSGVDGIFRKSCEKTMQVLRENKSMILTILEVLLYDPLYAWALTNEMARHRQNVEIIDVDEHNVDDRKNTMAERALIRLEGKLNGREQNTIVGSLSVEAHVEMLIRASMNPVLLCRLYHGWQPYL